MNKLEKIISVLENPATYNKINNRVVQVFREELVPIIYEAGVNFPRDKESMEWQKHRLFSLPPSTWMLGVWTGATYTALVQGGVPEREVITEVSHNKAVIRIKDSQYLNATLYINEPFKGRLLGEAKRVIMELIR